MRIHPKHLTAIGYCRRNTRRFFVRHKLDWPLFLKQGLPEEQFLATQDHMAIELVKAAHGQRR